MYLLTQDQVASVLSNTPNAAGGIVCGAGGLDRFKDVLLAVTSRVEELLEIDTLSRVSISDRFDLPYSRDLSVPRNLRLAGAFLVPDTYVIVDSTITQIDASFDVDAEYGVIRGALAAGSYTVTYEQGFEADSNGVFLDVPEWMKSIAKYAVAHHYRITSQVGSTPQNVSFGELTEATRRELYARVSKRYNRPRYDMLFPTRSTING